MQCPDPYAARTFEQAAVSSGVPGKAQEVGAGGAMQCSAHPVIQRRSNAKKQVLDPASRDQLETGPRNAES